MVAINNNNMLDIVTYKETFDNSDQGQPEGVPAFFFPRGTPGPNNESVLCRNNIHGTILKKCAAPEAVRRHGVLGKEARQIRNSEGEVDGKELVGLPVFDGMMRAA